MKKPIRIGLVGYGYWGPNYARLIQSHADTLFTGCVDTCPQRQDAFKQNYPDVFCTSTLKELIARVDLDAIIIATPTITHEDLTHDGLTHGLHILCEKPLSLDSKICIKLQKLALHHKKKLMVDHTFLFDGGIQYLKKALKKQELGTLHYLEAVRTNLGPIRQDSDVLADLASHDIAVFNHLLEASPLAVSASGASFLKHTHTDIAFVTLYYPQNIMAHLHVSWLSPVKKRTLTVVGSKKMATWDALTPQTPVKIHPHYAVQNANSKYEAQCGKVYTPDIAQEETLNKVFNTFIESLDQQSQPLSNGYFAKTIAEVLQAIEIAIKTETQVKIPVALP